MEEAGKGKGTVSRVENMGRKFWQGTAALLALEVTAGVTLTGLAFGMSLEGLPPYDNWRRSVLDVCIASALVGGASLASLPRGVFRGDDVPGGFEAACWRTTLLQALLGCYLIVKAVLFQWADVDTGVITASACVLGTTLLLCFGGALLAHVARDACAEEQKLNAALYSRLLGEDGEDGADAETANGGGGDDEDGERELNAYEVIKTLKPYFWPRSIVGRCFVGLTWVCVLGSKAAGVVAPFFIKWAAEAVEDDNLTPAIRDIGIFGALMFASKTLKECQSLAYLRVAQAAFTDLAEDTFRHVHTLSLHWHLKKKLGEVVRVTDRGISACDTLMRYGVLYLGPAILECLSVCILFLTYFDFWPLAVTCFVSVAVYAVVTIKLTLWRKQYRSKMNKADNAWHDKLTDSLVNYETVKYFTNEEYEVGQFLLAVDSYQVSNVEVLASLSALNISQQVILNGCLIGALILSAVAIHNGDMTLGDFVAVNTWVNNLFVPLNFLGSVYNAIVTAWVDLKNLSQLFAEEPDVTDAPHAKAMPALPPSTAHPGLGLSFRNVKFVYKENGRGLKGVSFQVAAGTTTALVGHTGAGKTTVSRLLFRFYDPTAGAVLLDGTDIRQLTQKSLRETIGVVPQDTVLFNDTIRHNVLYGKLDATQEELEAAAEGAQILDFIRALPDGWETMVGERGLKLSGGEKQRVAIARCLLKDPPVVLLDEATSALDSRTEKSVQAALNALGKNRTCVVIAHRLGTIQHADQIIVLDNGLINEQGSHDELIALGGEYYHMWEAQKLKPAEEAKESPVRK